MSVRPEGLLGAFKINALQSVFQSLYLHFILTIKYAVQSYTKPHLLPFIMIYFICDRVVKTTIYRNLCTQHNDDTLMTSW